MARCWCAPGDWDRAESVLSEALRRRPNRGKGGGHSLPLAVLAELRLRQGRSEEAGVLLADAEGEREALAPLVRVHLERGDLELAHALLERGAETSGDDGGILVLRGALALAESDLQAAAAAAARLRDAAEALDRDDLRAEAALLAGRIAAAEGDADAARSALERAAGGFTDLGYPLEAARARLALADAAGRRGLPARAGHGARRRATPSRSSAPAATPTGPAHCCANWASPAGGSSAASATS